MEEMKDGEDATGRSSRWRRRETRRERERRRIKKHGASLQRVYVNAVRKRVRRLGQT